MAPFHRLLINHPYILFMISSDCTISNGMITADLGEVNASQFIEYYQSHEAEIEKLILKYGVIKFLGVTIDSTETFKSITHSIANEFLPYIDGNSPRTKLIGDVYTSTEYDKTQHITMHNELSYSAFWPNRIFFNCLIPAEKGGETLLADSRKILEEMDPSIVSEIEKRGVAYIRNLHGGDGMGPSWQDTFETNSKTGLEDYCKSLGIVFSWGDRDSLKLRQTHPGIINHRISKDRIWFNQIDQFHPYHLGDEIYELMADIYGSPESFPMYVTYGDGTEIEIAMVQEILSTIDSVTYAPVWQANELLIVDNERTAHGRNPFEGDRKVIVAMTK